MVTIKDVANEAGVSIATVSAVVNDSRPVAKSTRKKVMKIIEEMGYNPNPVARALKKGKTKRILYMVPSIKNLVFAQFIDKVQQALIEKGYDLILLNNEARSDLTKSYLSIIHPSNIDGVIMTQTRTCGEIIKKTCKNKSIPLVVLFEPDIFNDVSMVTSEEQTGIEKAVDHLLAKKHKKIGFLKVEDSRNQMKRYQSFINKLEKEKVDFDDKWLIECDDHDEQASYKAVHSYLETEELEFTALLACNDFLSLGAIRALRDSGFRVPEDISIIGYDDSIAEYLHPTLTSIKLPKENLANKAVELLLNQIEQEDSAVQTAKYEQDLVVRESVISND
ncbi:LacI family transcriptional regulator [Halanaerobium saccharolyticum]|uniref:LacI family transcriptional regulator n=1 Tax=Halanaerobium saccharolyticum TaxID=43595 RepID=A0A4V3G4P8_9FIRM|nr:LacI family DNA-binding transcriptional regulator [Halanaerobium saccharolyticum]RAK06310.1 LacI family transcriptional regulator [Halanaerobium saccharolyticum]TDW00789.1 LacI family transcriptional regulator [Halanaerobium saccharolyticum]TDX52431.1 LacI family transcriptional regulator [Halanaerobium saccharolyticum]